MLPLPTNPLTLVYRGSIPALKNDLTLRIDRQGRFVGKGRRADISRFLKESSTRISEQWALQGFDKVSEPVQLGVMVHLGVYIAPSNKTGLPKSDLDNAYTTIQETWQNVVIDDDRQIADIHITRCPIPSRDYLHTLVFLWVLDTDKIMSDRLYSLESFFQFYTQFYKGKTILELLNHGRK